MDIHMPEDNEGTYPGVILIHGGGPRHPRSTGIEVMEDAQDAVTFLRDNAEDYRIDPEATAWNQYSPYYNCCTSGNLTAATPLLMFNSYNEVLALSEPEDTHDLVAATSIPVTKVILAGAGHAFYADDYLIDFDRLGLDDNIERSDDVVLDFQDLEVQQATADYFLAHLM